MSKLESLGRDFDRAVSRLEEACERLRADPQSDSLLRDGLIQRFEFSFELGWKTVQAKAAAEGVVVRSPKSALAHALASGWIESEANWFRILEARNLSSHTYNERTAAELAVTIFDFLEPLLSLADALRSPKH